LPRLSSSKNLSCVGGAAVACVLGGWPWRACSPGGVWATRIDVLDCVASPCTQCRWHQPVGPVCAPEGALDEPQERPPSDHQ
jgi:hypothetical protein